MTSHAGYILGTVGYERCEQYEKTYQMIRSNRTKRMRKHST